MFDHLSELDISRTVFHDVPSRRLQQDSTLELSDVETVLDDTKRNLLRTRLVDGLQKRGYHTVVDTGIQSLVPPMVSAYLSRTNDNFVNVSQHIARFLYEKQLGYSASGVLAMAECRLRSRRALALIKLEKASGFLPDRSSDGGIRRFDLEFATEVLLTERVRILKAGLLGLDGAGINGILGMVVDNQIRGRQDRPAANYFLRQFLGCKLRDDSASLTKRCFDEASKWINTRVDSTHDQFRYRMSLLSEMLRDVNAIDLEQFAIEHMDIRHQADFLRHMADAGVSIRSIPKNTDRIRSNLRQVQTQVADGIHVITRSDTSSDRVSIVKEEGGPTVITIWDPQDPGNTTGC